MDKIGKNYEYIDEKGLNASENSPIVGIKPYILRKDAIPREKR